jgi:sterol 24-C-methyltransferase
MKPRLGTFGRDSLGYGGVAGTVQSYRSLQGMSEEERGRRYGAIVRQFYDLVTDFYEFGWGQSFHFAPRFQGESLTESIARHERFIADRLQLAAGMKVLDIGCGVGGPMRNIARYSQARVTGVNLSEYQIRRGSMHNRKAGLEGLCGFVRADFMKLPIASDSYDAAYDFEATCHTSDKAAVYREIFRTLRPGASFAGNDWCLTPKYRANDPEHRRIKREIEIGNGLPDIDSIETLVAALKSAGFELVEYRDMAATVPKGELPWYLPIAGRWSVSGFKHTRAGRWGTYHSVRALEALKIAPPGSARVSAMLNATAVALVQAGELGIFTPLLYFHARKPF